MAVVLAFRIAIKLAPAVAGAAHRIVQWEQGPGLATLSRRLHQRLQDPDESDAALSAAVSDETDRLADVTTFADPFELRKLQAIIGRTSGAATPEDDAVMTFHFIKAPGGVPSSTWLEADFLSVESAFDTFWNAVKVRMLSMSTLRQLRWYKTGPQVDEDLGGPGRTGPPVRVVDRALPGTSGATVGSPPQIAMSITEKTSDKQAWGRVYLPGPFFWANVGTINGRYTSTFQTEVGNAGDAFYEACKAANLPIVVYSSEKPVRPTAAGGTLPAKAARALTVDELQIDDIPDVIRSRRYKAPLLRLLRAIA